MEELSDAGSIPARSTQSIVSRILERFDEKGFKNRCCSYNSLLRTTAIFLLHILNFFIFHSIFILRYHSL